MAVRSASGVLRIFGSSSHLGTASRTTALINTTVRLWSQPTLRVQQKLITQSTYSPILLRLENFHVISSPGTTYVTLGCRLFVLRPHNSFPYLSPRMNISLQSKDTIRSNENRYPRMASYK